MRKNNEGQVLLIVLLVMATAVTVGLSVISRSVSDISVTTKEEESIRAFSAAEAGIEQILVSNVAPGGAPIQSQVGGANEAAFQASVIAFPQPNIGAGGRTEYPYPYEIAGGDSVTVWFAGHDDDGDLVCTGTGDCFIGYPFVSMCWGKQGTAVSDSTTPAVAVSIVYQDAAGSVGISKFGVDPNAPRRALNGFIAPTAAVSSGACVSGTTWYSFLMDFDLRNQPQPPVPAAILDGVAGNGHLILMTVRMLYNGNNPQTLAVMTAPGNPLPSQGRKIDSVGTAGSASRKVEVYTMYPEIPSIFQGALFSPSDIRKN